MPRYIDADALLENLKRQYGEELGWIDTVNMSDVGMMIDDASTADVVPKSEDGAECPTCHGTGRIGTTNWLTKNMTKKQIAEEKAKAIAEHEKHIKAEVAREIFEEIESSIAVHAFTSKSEDYADGMYDAIEWVDSKIAELKKKYTEGQNENT